MDIVVHPDATDFWQATGPIYESDPVRHTVALTVIHRLLHGGADGPEPLLLSFVQRGRTVGAVFRTPPWPIGASALPLEAIPVLVEFLRDRDPGGVAGPRETTDRFAKAWAEATGAPVREAMAQRMYRLGDLLPPHVPGEFRLATERDVPQLVRFRKAFSAEALDGIDDPTWAEGELRRTLAMGNAQGIWSVAGEPVAHAAASLPLNGMSRVGPVYTPPEHRRYGYGSAVTAAVSQWALDHGAERVLLFTDLANPTSNSIYQKLGYAPVDDYVEYAFGTTVA